MASLGLFRGAAAAITFSALSAVAAPGGAAAAAPACDKGTNVTLGTGSVICGNAVSGAASSSSTVPLYRYLGIRYANAARWQGPAMAAPPSGTAQAPAAQTVAGSQCPQKSGGVEDCLFINVWTPQSAVPNGKLPVMVFIHGGAFVLGSGSSFLYDGSTLAANGVVVVTLNYRLGALGFLAANNIPSTPNKNDTTTVTLNGNYGLMDQQTALLWVQKYISAFGGDPGQVTVFGESAGAMSVGLHLFSVPSSNPATGTALFQAAMMESNPVGSQYRTQAQAQTAGWAFIDNLCEYQNSKNNSLAKCNPSYTWLAGMSAADIVKVQDKFTGAKPKDWIGPVSPTGATDTSTPLGAGLMATGGVNDALPFSPNIDGQLVQGQPGAGYVTGTKARPFVFGTNKDEGALFGELMVTLDSSVKSQSGYDGLLSAIFSPTGAQTIETYTVNNQTPYQAPASGSSQSTISTLINDFAFQCANPWMVGKANGPATTYGYHFTQPPIVDLYWEGPIAVPACTAASGNVCHGNEMPYVFNTIAALYNKHNLYPKFDTKSGDQALAYAMASAWAGFAKTPTSPPAPWTAYSTGNVVQWVSAKSGSGYTTSQTQTAASLATASNCAFWTTPSNGFYPLN